MPVDLSLRKVRSDLLRFDFPSGTYGFFTGEGSFAYDGVTYKGAGALFAIDAIPGSTDGSASSVSIRLNADADIGVTSTVLSQIEAESYRGRPVTISRAYFDADTYALLNVFTLWRGYIDVIVHAETAGGEAYLEATCESRALDLGRSGYRRRTDADQRRIDANDRSLRHVQAAAAESVYWGRVKPEATR